MGKIARFTLAVAATVYIGLGAQSVLANDAKVYPGSMCIARDGASQGSAFYDYLWEDGSIRNSSGNIIWAICPIVRDSTVSDIADVDVSMQLDAGEELDCYIVSCTATGSTCDEEAGNWGPGGGRQTQDMTVPSAWSDGFYYLECSMEPGAEIVSFRVEEGT
ncbi:MAG: hypothetical protein HYY06_26820 [Deltaproteobacteria bacterium]|nr:hypothetical protein [Deltaproteobacteria bacterium]